VLPLLVVVAVPTWIVAAYLAIDSALWVSAFAVGYPAVTVHVSNVLIEYGVWARTGVLILLAAYAVRSRFDPTAGRPVHAASRGATACGARRTGRGRVRSRLVHRHSGYSTRCIPTVARLRPDEKALHMNARPERPADSAQPARTPRPQTSRVIDRITDALGDEKAFAVAVVLVIAALVAGLLSGHLAAVASLATLITFVMVFAVQHTSSRESRALNLKMDEIIRVSTARNEFIGAEDESHAQLDQRRQDLLDDRRFTTESG
jgi:low affinity Fe/Cu permease